MGKASLAILIAVFISLVTMVTLMLLGMITIY